MILDLVSCLIGLFMFIVFGRNIAKKRSVFCFSQVWESTEMHRQGLRIKTGNRVLSVAGAGDVAFGFLLDDPAAVVGLDVSSDQIYLCELKKVAIEHLTREKCLQMLGYNLKASTSSERVKTYLDIRRHLPVETRNYWDARIDVVENGIIHNGVLGEVPHHFMSQNVVSWFIKPEVVYSILKSKPNSREALIQKTGCESFLVRLCVRIAYAWLFWMVTFVDIKFQYRAPSIWTYLNPVKIVFKTIMVTRRLGVTCRNVLANSKKALRNIESDQSFLIEYMLTGDVTGDIGLPDYLQVIKTKINKISFVAGDVYAVSSLEESQNLAGGAFDAINLSNVPQPAKVGSGPAARKNVNVLFVNLEKVSKDGTRLVFLAMQQELTFPKGETRMRIVEEEGLAHEVYEANLMYSPMNGYRMATFQK